MKETIEIIRCPQCQQVAAAGPNVSYQAAGNDQAPPPLTTLAAAFPQLEILELIGAGGMGCVYKARQPKLERLVALKLLTQTRAGDASFTARFHREARLLARLNHPGIVSVYDYGESGGFVFLLMEFVDGINLRQAMQARPFSPQQALSLVSKICDALQFAHDEGVLHRDIKPENILLDSRGRVKIADFGIAKFMGQNSKGPRITASGLAIGTPHYMAPEQIEHPHDVDQRADIYSLGVVFYEILTGELPIGRFSPPSLKTPVDPRVDQIILQALAKERDRRQHNVAELKTEVEQIASSPMSEAIALKTASCYVSTPEFLRTLRGRFFSIYQGKGELHLGADALRFSSGWQVVTIPLTSIDALALGEYPISAKVAPLNYLEVNFHEHGAARRLLFTPMKRALRPGWKANELVEDWLAALKDAIRAATGRALPLNHSTLAPAQAWRELLKVFLLSSLVCAIVFALIPLIMEHRLPNRLADFLPGPIIVVSTLATLLGFRWWRHRRGVLAYSEPAALPNFLERWWLARPATLRKWVRGVFVAVTLVAGSRFLGYSMEYNKEQERFVRHWSVGIAHPWLRTTQPNTGSGFLGGLEFNAATDSFVTGIVALLLGLVTGRLYRAERAALPFATQVVSDTDVASKNQPAPPSRPQSNAARRCPR